MKLILCIQINSEDLQGFNYVLLVLNGMGFNFGFQMFLKFFLVWINKIALIRLKTRVI